jgi:hypothetical protein
VQVDPNIGTPLSDGLPNGAKFESNFGIETSTANQYSTSVASEGYENPACIGCGNPLSIGGPFLVTYTETLSSTDSDVYGQLLDWRGDVQRSKFPIATGTNFDTVIPKSVAFNGSIYLVTWGMQISTAPYYIGIYATRVERDGDVLDSPSFAALDTSGAELGGAVWSGPGNKWGVAAQSNANAQNRILFSLVSPK